MNSNTHAWPRLCLALVGRAYGWNGSGVATARQAAQIEIDAGLMSRDTTNIPAGAVMWWDGSATGNEARQVAIYDGHGYIYSNNVPVTDGRVPSTYPVNSWGQNGSAGARPTSPTLLRRR
jgi:hypothetical protein